MNPTWLEVIRANIDAENIKEFQFSTFILEARDIVLKNSPNREDLSSVISKLGLGSLNKDVLVPYLMEKCRYRPETMAKKMSEISPAL